MPCVFVDGYLDPSGHGEFLVQDGFSSDLEKTRELWSLGDELLCYDVRTLIRMGLPIPWTDSRKKFYDLRMIYGHDGDLASLVRRVQPKGMGEFLDLDRRWDSNLRAAREGRLDLATIPYKDFIPEPLRREYLKTRLEMVKHLLDNSGERALNYEKKVLPLFRNILEVESAGIKVDEQLLLSSLERTDLAVHERSFLQQGTLDHLQEDGKVYTRISPIGSRTSRLRVEGGFNCMGIPHGLCRRVLRSRFEGGTILVLDFNAIDYRCLVKAVNDPKLNEFYKDCKDFHGRTASLFGDVTPELRDLTKKVTYTSLYGGTMQTLQKQTLKTQDELLSMLDTLKQLFEPIEEFRIRMAEEARRSGFVMTPDGTTVKVEPGDHDGKIVGLYAQTFSSWMFNRALHAVLCVLQASSKVIFTVHDELVVDLHPLERNLIGYLKGVMEGETGFVVKAKEGKNYGEATDG